MAHRFDGSGEASKLGNSAVGMPNGAPLTLACWFNSDSASASGGLLGIGATDANNTDAFFLLVDNGVNLDARTRDGGSATFARATASVSNNTWHHACGVYRSSTDRSCFLDGGNEGTNSTSKNPATPLDNIRIAALLNGGTDFDGDIAEAAIWDTDLTNEEVAALGKGASPLTIRPGNLVAYWPMIRDSGTLNDKLGVNNLNLIGTTGPANHPRIATPFVQNVIPPESAAPTDRNITANQTEAGDTQVAALGSIVEVSANQNEAGDTQTAALEVVLAAAEITANQTEDGDSQTAALSNIVEITANQAEAGDTQAASLGSIVEVSANQTEAGDTSTAALANIAQMIVTGKHHLQFD